MRRVSLVDTVHFSSYNQTTMICLTPHSLQEVSNLRDFYV